MIPVAKPLLPLLSALSKYFSRIDESRWYSNFGPLAREYEARLEEHFGGYVVSTSSGTIGLIATLMALELPKNSTVACPSYTFIATPAAILAAGHEPSFIETDTISHRVRRLGEWSSFRMGVYPFGTPCIPREYTLIDAAAGFDTVKASNVPTIVSTHATKPFSTGEGGFVLCDDKNLIEEIRVIINNGLSPDRSVKVHGINGKLSEYHAAIGLASLDEWEVTRERWKEVGKWYGRGEFACSTQMVELPCEAAPIAKKLKAHGIDTRLNWYGCHQHHAYRAFPRGDLTKTEKLMSHTISLPMAVDMTKDQVDYVQEALNEST